MIHSKSLKANKMAVVAGCSRRSICAINRNLRCFGSTKAPSNGGGQPRSITPLMLDALCKYLEKDPSKYLYKMMNFLQTKFEVSMTTSSVRRALDSIPWTKKQIRRVAKGRNADLRDTYLYNISDFSPEHFIFVDESSCDRRVRLRRTGWSPLGVTPTQVALF
jgi:hypothetical protein